jgi:hypothetical protein
MITTNWVVQSKTANETRWTKDEVILPDTINLGEAKLWLDGFVNNPAPDTVYRLIVRKETEVKWAQN